MFTDPKALSEVTLLGNVMIKIGTSHHLPYYEHSRGHTLVVDLFFVILIGRIAGFVVFGITVLYGQVLIDIVD